MKNIIVGTSGHIDHGKTCLIRALTGIETDRLKEEKNRGITIELGFANLKNDLDMDIGIIDVPGHEKFVKHMLAGIGGLDIVLLVVAGDEGFMPQTKEHFEILKSLDIKKGIIVITKKDMVDDEWLEVVRDDIKENTKNSFLENAPIVEVSSHTKEGIDDLRNLILEFGTKAPAKEIDSKLLRLPVDRVFSVVGFGTVVTGTLIEGSVKIGDEIMIYPQMKKTKVRNIQVHNEKVDEAFAGQRTAINLANIKKEEIDRGNVIAYPDSLENTRMIDVKIDMFENTDKILKNGSRLHFYHGASENLCKAILLDKETIEKGESAFAQLRFEDEISVKRGDKFILRFYSPTETIAGGEILNPIPRKHKRYQEKIIQSLENRASLDDKILLEQIFDDESYKLENLTNIVRAIGYSDNKAIELIDRLKAEEKIVEISKELVFSRGYIEYLKDKIYQILNEFHKSNPVTLGMQKEEFRNKLARAIGTENFKIIEQLIEYFLSIGYIKEENSLTSLGDFTIEYTKEQLKLLESLESKYKNLGIETKDISEIITEYKDKKLIKQLILVLEKEGKLERLSPGYYIDKALYDNLVKELVSYIEKNGKITLGEYRDLTNSSRKYCMMILEHTDSQGITQMVENYRILR